MIHDRTTIAISIGTVGGYLAGSMLSGGPAFIGAAIAGTVAIAITPDSETIAEQWNEYTEGSA